MKCAFCGQHRDEVKKLVSGRDANAKICDQCIRKCIGLLQADSGEALDSKTTKQQDKFRPRKLVKSLDKYIIGQAHAKKALAVAVYNHLKRTLYQPKKGDVELSKGNVLLLGPSGSGKTAMVQALAKIIDVPLLIVDATPLTSAGYVGEDPDVIIKKLLRLCDNDPKKAERGIVYIDEVCKIAHRKSTGRDVSGESVQQMLLKIVEGGPMTMLVGGNQATGFGGERIKINTTNILFIAGGAFTGLAERVAQRETPCGFLAADGKKPRTLAEVEAVDLHKYGMLPEFVGRFPIRVAFDALTEAMLMRILTEPRNALVRQYQRLFAMSDNTLEFTPDGLEAIARLALARGTGARGLRGVLEELLLEPMFNAPSQPLTTDDLSAVVNTVRFNDTTFRVCSECFTWTVHKNRGAFVDADNKPAIFFPRLDPRNRRVLRTRATAVLT